MMVSQRMMSVAWPAFLMAGVLEILIFAVVDPHDMHWFGQPFDMSRQGIYTLAFFAFWLVTALSSMLTTYLTTLPLETRAQSI